MDFYSITDKAIEVELGGRIKSLRLRRNLTQQQLADACALSLNSIKSMESGKGKLSSLVAILRELQALDALDSFIPSTGISPLQLAKLKGKARQRASGVRGQEPAHHDENKDDIEW